MVTYMNDMLSHLPLREPTFFILLSLSPGPKHGYAILKEVEALSDGRVRLSTGTLYGAIVSNVVFLPFAEKLGFISKQELVAMEIIVRGIMAIQSGDNPRVIEQKLNTFIAP